jgi:hypothetical protein
MCNKYQFDPVEAYELPKTVKGRILKALYGDSEKAENVAEKDMTDCVSERIAQLQSAADMLTANQRPVCEFDMRYAMMWAYWRASEAFEDDPSLKNALILCSVSVCETILKGHGYLPAKEDKSDGD